MRGDVRWAIVLAAAAAATGAAAAQVQLEPMYATGHPLPMIGPDVVLSRVYDPEINASGAIVFDGTVAGPGIVANVNDGVVLTNRNGVLELLARSGEPGPGTDGLPVLAFQGVNINDSNAVAIAAYITIVFGGLSDGLIWYDGGAGLQKLIRTNDPAPIPEPDGAFGGPSGDPDGPVFNNAGQVIIVTKLQGATIADDDDGSLWIVDATGPSLVARQGDPAPTTDPAVPFLGEFSPFLPSLSNAGSTVFSQVIGLNPTVRAVWTGSAGNLQMVARTGDPLPGVPGVHISFPTMLFGNLTDEGDFAFFSFLSGDGVTSANGAALLAGGTSGGLRLVARSGNVIDGVPPGLEFTLDTQFDPGLNGNGDVLFRGRLRSATGVTSRGLMLEQEGQTRMIAHTAQSPQAPVPYVSFSSFGSAFFNASGLVVLRASVTDGAIGSSDWPGLWYIPRDGELTPLVVPGQVIDLGDGVARTVRFATAIGSFLSQGRGSGCIDGRPTPLNEAGQLAVSVRFTDESSAIMLATFSAACPCERDDMEGIDVFDLLAYLDEWFASDAAAELTGDDPASIDVFDLLAFLDCWFNASAGGEC